MNFKIFFTNSSDLGSWGELWLGEAREHFETDFGYWNRKQYEQSWTAAIVRVLKSNAPAALVVCLTAHEDRFCVDWWPMYPVGDKDYFQNQIPSLPRSPIGAEDSIFDHIPRRHPRKHVSEWALSTGALQSWLDCQA
jgi:hypothetical protein